MDAATVVDAAEMIGKDDFQHSELDAGAIAARPLLVVGTACVKRAVLGAIGSRVAVERRPSCRRSHLWIAFLDER